MRRVLTCLLSNNPGVLNRFTGTLTRRQVNIDSISISPVGDKSASRVTAVIYLDDTAAAKQLVAQLNKQIDVLEIHDITEQPHIERELALIRVNAATNKRAELFAMVQPFRADVVDVTNDPNHRIARESQRTTPRSPTVRRYPSRTHRGCRLYQSRRIECDKGRLTSGI